MGKKLEFQTRLRQFSAGTLFVHIPQKICEDGNLVKGNKVLISMEGIIDEDIKEFFCPVCQYRFCSSEDLIKDELICPACGCPDINNILEEKKNGDTGKNI